MSPMTPNLSPLVWMVAIQFLISALGWALFSLLVRSERAAVLHWSGFMLLLGLGFVLASRRDEAGAWVPYLGSNLAFLAAYMLLRRGLEHFTHEPLSDREQLVTFILLLLALFWAGQSPHNAYWRVVISYGGGALLLLRTATLLRGALQREFGARLSWIVTLPGWLVAVLSALRCMQQVLAPERNFEMHLDSPSNQGLLYGYLFGAALFSFSFMAMVTMRLVAQLGEQARHDPLTGLSNRRALELAGEQVWHAWRQRRRGFSVLALDLDHFKNVNDAHGHPAGDLLLEQLAQRLSQAMRDDDTLARTGGEEFVVLMPGASIEGALAAAERLRSSVAEVPFDLQQAQVPMTVSVGVTRAAATDQTLGQVQQRADHALYRAKNEGRNRVVFESA